MQYVLISLMKFDVIDGRRLSVSNTQTTMR